MPTVFISYRRSDSGPWAGRLYSDLARVLSRSQLFMAYWLELGTGVELEPAEAEAKRWQERSGSAPTRLLEITGPSDRAQLIGPFASRNAALRFAASHDEDLPDNVDVRALLEDCPADQQVQAEGYWSCTLGGTSEAPRSPRDSAGE